MPGRAEGGATGIAVVQYSPVPASGIDEGPNLDVGRAPHLA